MANKRKKKRQIRGLKDALSTRSAEQAAQSNIDSLIQRGLTSRTFSLRLETLNESARSVDATIATESPVMVFDWARWEPVEEILVMAGCRFADNGQVPMLDTHNRYTIDAQLGSTRNLRVEGDKLVGANTFSSTDEGDRAFTKVKEGHVTDNSVGYRVLNSVTIDAGKEAEVNGKKYTASPTRALRVTTEWEVVENSLCPIGADSAAKVRNIPSAIAAGEVKRNDDTKIVLENDNMNFRQWLTDKGFDHDKMDESQRASMKVWFDAEQTREAGGTPPADVKPAAADDSQRAPVAAPAGDVVPAGDADVAAVTRQAIADERTRVSAIRAAGDGLDANIVEKCITDGDSIERASVLLLEAIRTARPGGVGSAPNIIIGSGSDMSAVRMTDALLLREGMEDIVLAEAEGQQRCDQADKIRDISMEMVCRHALQIEGKQVPMGREDLIRAAFTTSTLPTILGAVYNKSLMKGYNSVEPTWRQWCNTGSASDFKTATRVRLTGSKGFEKLNAKGELAKQQLTEEKEQLALETYGHVNLFGRKDIINDDLTTLIKQPTRDGRDAQLLIGELVYTHLLANGDMDDSVALFHADHSNLNTSKALTMANLKNAIIQYGKQTDLAGKPVKVSPRILLVPIDLMFTAEELLHSVDIVLAGSTDTVRGRKNVVAGKLKPVAEEALSNSTYTGYSATSWYVMADPAEADTVEVAFLNGRQTPTMRMFNAMPRVLGVQFESYIDVVAKAIDFRTMQKNNA